jgi:hypothetical protein
MPFNTYDPTQNTKFEKTNFLKTTPGTHLIRFIEDPATAKMVFTHYVAMKYTVQCSGEDCPICANNKKLFVQYGDDARKQSSFNSRTPRFIINVLDRTVAKTCPQCGLEVKPAGPRNTFPASCPECNTFLNDVQAKALNVVKILTFGNQLATGLNSLEKAICDPNGNPIGLMNFDIALQVEGVLKKKTITPIPMTGNVDKITVAESDLQDKNNATISLTGAEITELMRGTALKDLYAARRGTAASSPAPATTDAPPWQDKEDIAKTVGSILG